MSLKAFLSSAMLKGFFLFKTKLAIPGLGNKNKGNSKLTSIDEKGGFVVNVALN